MATDTVTVTLPSDVGYASSFTTAYPSGRTRADYDAADTDHILHSASFRSLYQSKGEITVTFGTSLITVRLNLNHVFSASERLYLELQRGDADTDRIDLIEARQKETRAALVTHIAENGIEAGAIYSDGTVQYLGSTGATDISDLPGLTWLDKLTPEHFGAVGDGVTDDTTACQAMLNAMSQGAGAALSPGAIYGVTNLKLPKFSSGQVETSIVCPNGMATIKRLAGGTTTHMVAPAKWVENLAFADTPFRFENIIFDGNNICDYPFICRSYASRHINCKFVNGLKANVLFTMMASDGTTAAATVMSECQWIGCRFISGASTSEALFRTVSDGSGNGPADGEIRDCAFDSNAVAPYGIDIAAAGGWSLIGNHAYNATTKDLRIRNLKRPAAIAANTFEDGGVIDAAGETSAQIGPGNAWWESLEVNFAATPGSEQITVTGDSFVRDKSGSASAQLILQTASTPKRLYSIGNTFRGTTGTVDNSGNDRLTAVASVLDANFIGYDGHLTNRIRRLGLGKGSGETLTISSGAITMSGSFVKVDTEGAAASDDLDTISGGVVGDVLVLVAADSARTVVVKDSTGNIRLPADRSLDSNQDTLTLIYNGSAWLEVSFADNGT